MNTLPLVAPEAREIVAHAPTFDPAHETVADARAGVLALFPTPDDPVPHEEHTAPGPTGSPAVRVLLYRPDGSREPRPAILSLYGGGFIAGTPDMMAAANLKLAQDNAAVVVAPDVTGLPPTFIGVGSLDLFLEEDVAYALRLARAGVPTEAHVYNGGVHGFDGLPGPLAAKF